MAKGFHGKVLVVDLSLGSTELISLSEKTYQEVLGGYGLGVRFLLDHMAPDVAPLGPGNILGFVPGLLNGAGALFGGRFAVVGKSPLTSGWGDANCGGHFGPALRSTGLDGVFLRGVSSAPVYLEIDGDGVAIKDAGDLWGKQTGEVETVLRDRVGPGAQAAAIGPAGENLSLIAAIMTDGGRAAARSGLGAVMGSKRVKAVVVRGEERLPVHDAGRIKQLNRAYGRIFRGDGSLLSRLLFPLCKRLAPVLRMLRVKPSGPTDSLVRLYRDYGTSGATAISTEIGDTPVWNWRGVAMRDFPLARSLKISDDAVAARTVRSYHCHQCPVGCGGIVEVQDVDGSSLEAHKPEYETLAAFGPLVLNDDLDAIIRINSLCDQLGLDTISTGATIAFALECAEKGLLDGAAGGHDLEWGDADVIITLVRQIAHRTGMGEILADGVQRASERIGAASHPFAMHAGGQELPMHDSRYEPAVGVGCVVDPTPGKHTPSNSGFVDFPVAREIFEAEGFRRPGRHEYDKKGEEFALINRYLQVVNAAGLCMFSLMMGRPPVRDWINASTGWELTLGDLLHIGHRVQVLRHLFNLRSGISPEDIQLPDRALGKPPLQEGPLRGVSLDMEAMKRSYFRAMGFSDDGLPTPELLESLNLSQEQLGLLG